jgi:pilus assembly protein Flp/PilA
MDSLNPLVGRVRFAISAVYDREDGQSLVEYALILLLVSIVSIALLGALGTEVSTLFSRVNGVF